MTTETAPTSTIDRPRPRPGVGFAAAAVSFVAVFAAGGTAIPLYDSYRTTNGVTNAELSLVAVAYFLFAVIGLVVLGRLSNHLGRKTVSIAALLVATAGCLILMTVNGPGQLLIGRALQGLAAGLASSALAAYAVDTAPRRPAWLVSTVTSAATTVGLAIGSFASGALVEYGPAPRHLVFIVFAIILVASAGWVATGPETIARTPGARRSLRPSLFVPQSARPYLLVASGIFVATWALGGYYQAFGPSIAADDLGSSNALVAAAVFASYMAPAVLGGPIFGKFRPATAQRVGMSLVLVCAAGLVLAITLGSAPVFLAAGIVGGVGMGAGMSGSMRVLLPQASGGERAGLLSVIYAISYTGAAIPSLIAGQLSRTLSLLDVTIGYGILIAVVFALTLVRAHNPKAPVAMPAVGTES